MPGGRGGGCAESLREDRVSRAAPSLLESTFCSRHRHCARLVRADPTSPRPKPTPRPGQHPLHLHSPPGITIHHHSSSPVNLSISPPSRSCVTRALHCCLSSRTSITSRPDQHLFAPPVTSTHLQASPFFISGSPSITPPFLVRVCSPPSSPPLSPG